MKVIHSAKDLGNGSRNVCLAIGVFDGVHLGHQQIIRQTIADARQHDALAVVITFDRHPNAVVAPDRVPPQIFSRSQKLRAIGALGTDALLEIPFDKAFSEQSGETFIRGLIFGAGKIKSICVGADFVFGHKRSGNVELLRRLGKETGFQVHGLAAVALDGSPVSSTRIREMIRCGDFDAASQMLGRPYAICGNVIRGDQIGHKLGFPTANLNVSQLILPPNGVYAAYAAVDGKGYRAALNIGMRPTVATGQPELRVEAHLLDFAGDLYNRELELQMVAKLRDERRFGTVEALRKQIGHDIETVRALD